MKEHQSEVARLFAQIDAEYEAAIAGMSGLAAGTARHDFITQKMEKMGQHFEELAEQVGSRSEAMAIYAQRLKMPPEGPSDAQI